MHPATLEVERLLRDCELKAVRASGPGGQHRNKVSTGIVLTHTPTGTIAEATERRSQAANREYAIRRLRVRLAIEIRTPTSDPTDDRLQEFGQLYGGVRLRVAEGNVDYPSVLALVLDRIQSDRGDLASIARLLNTTASQIVRFLREEPAALKIVNQWREAVGLCRMS